MRLKDKDRFRRILIWVWCSIVFLCAAWFAFTYISRKVSQSGKKPLAKASAKEPLTNEPGRWRRARDAYEESFKSQVERLSALGYLQGYNKAPQRKNVTVYDANLVFDGLNFYNSGHAAEAVLIDMEGNVLHKWTFDISNIWGIKGHPEPSTHWRRVHLYENGDILAIYAHIGMIKLDKDSNLLWSFRGSAPHHHMQVVENGNIYVLTEKLEIIPRMNKNEEVQHDFVVVLNPDGKIIGEHSVLECFENCSSIDCNDILDGMARKGDLFHTNTVEVFDGTLSHISDLFKKGNVLISPLFLNIIAIVDLEKDQVVWTLNGDENGLWKGMHEPVLLENGNILIFDNDWRKKGANGKSKVIEFNPFTKQIVWQYKGDKKHPFYSRTCGTNQRLPNGNTLITESDNGRAFEVTRDGEIVWEYVNPHRAGENNELIATLLHMRRIERDSVKWLSDSKYKPVSRIK